MDIELPLPPSVNRLEARRGNSSSVVQRWHRNADAHVLSDQKRIYALAVRGPFAIAITWTELECGHSDIDNRVKVLLDYLQRISLIDNDRDCRRLTVGWGLAPRGCRVRLEPWNE